ncbi:hypothetical protein LCGC14_2586560, partial [marine sediment metagenome]
MRRPPLRQREGLEARTGTANEETVNLELVSRFGGWLFAAGGTIALVMV